MNRTLKTATAALALLMAGAASADVTFYEHSNFEGRAFTTPHKVDDFRRFGFNDRVSSVVITGRQSWEVCEDVEFRGHSAHGLLAIVRMYRMCGLSWIRSRREVTPVST